MDILHYERTRSLFVRLVGLWLPVLFVFSCPSSGWSVQACFAAGSSDRIIHSSLFPIMPARRLLEIEPPGPFRYILGAVLMLVGVVLPLTYFMFRSKRTPPPSFKQTF
ncbi:unnamed protein product [Closterium sp. Yama58-4]|nr:unnamed protein product [Closterium sp. Yama58-4]